jgi:hypothetical protein
MIIPNQANPVVTNVSAANNGIQMNQQAASASNIFGTQQLNKTAAAAAASQAAPLVNSITPAMAAAML